MSSKTKIVNFEYESASCILVLWGDGSASLGEVYSKDRRKGHATNLLKTVMSWADEKKLFLKTAAEAHGPEPKLTQPQLIDFYKKFGFERTEDLAQEFVYMERKVS